jgi:hypothetical protein
LRPAVAPGAQEGKLLRRKQPRSRQLTLDQPGAQPMDSTTCTLGTTRDSSYISSLERCWPTVIDSKDSEVHEISKNSKRIPRRVLNEIQEDTSKNLNELKRIQINS